MMELTKKDLEKNIKDIDVNIENKYVLIVDDITDTGKSLSKVIKDLEEKNPKSISTSPPFDKSLRREATVKPDYHGFEIENEFIIGYELDYAENIEIYHIFEK